MSVGKTTLVNALKDSGKYNDFIFRSNLLRGLKELGIPINELGNTLVKTIFSDIKIDFWGGTKVISANSIWFNPILSYEHPSGGSNGTDFLWDSLWFDLDTNQWLEGRKLI